MLHVHRSDRTDVLVSMLGDLVADPLPDPMMPEVISVPTRGIERWLTQRLSAQLGASEGRARRCLRQHRLPVSRDRWWAARWRWPTDADPEADPWAPQRAVWPLIEVVEEHFDEPWLAPLAEHMSNSATAEGSRRFSSIRHMADLFDRYAVHRPDMLQRWAAGSPQLEESSWQVDLWRLLRERIGRPSPADRLVDACTRLREEPTLLDLPPRLSLFGLTRLPASYLDVLEAIGAGRDVHLFLLHPSPALWDRLRALRRATSRAVLRRRGPHGGGAEQPAARVLGAGRPRDAARAGRRVARR